MKTGIAYFGVRNPEFVKVDVNLIASSMYTHILHTFSEEDFHYYKDTMKEIIHVSNKCGLKVYVNPWGVGRVFGGEAYSELAARNRSMAQVNNHDETTVASCINNKAFHEYMFEWIDFVCSCEIETVFWDEPHFYFEKTSPEKWSCCCDVCKKKFRKHYGHTMPSSLTESVQEFREESLLEFLDIMTKRVKALNKRNSVCLLPSNFNDGISNWDKFAQLEAVDEIGTDPYWERGERIKTISQTYQQESKKILELSQKYNKQAQMWIKNYSIQKNNEDSIEQATWAAFNVGIRNIFAWSYRGSAYLSWLKSDDPDKVWEIQTNTFAECQEKSIGL